MALNIGKYSTEWAKFKAAWDTGAETATHKSGKVLNRFTEACRASPYIAGHLLFAAVILAAIGWLV